MIRKHISTCQEENLSFKKDNKKFCIICNTALGSCLLSVLMGITSPAAPCMGLTDRLSDCDGHLSADSLSPGGVQGTTATAHSQISFRRPDGAEFSPHVSFLPPSAIPALPLRQAGTSFVSRRFIKAKTAQMKREEAWRSRRLFAGTDPSSTDPASLARTQKVSHLFS